MTTATSFLWLVALVVFLVMESATTALVTIWFAVGSLAAFLLSVIGCGPTIQVATFILVSLATIIVLRPIFEKKLVPKRKATNTDRIIGEKGTVVEAIDNINALGQVKVLGAVWSARAEGYDSVDEGVIVRILRIEGAKVIVTPDLSATEPKAP